jgi:hypothetical protein
MNTHPRNIRSTLEYLIYIIEKTGADCSQLRETFVFCKNNCSGFGICTVGYSQTHESVMAKCMCDDNHGGEDCSVVGSLFVYLFIYWLAAIFVDQFQQRAAQTLVFTFFFFFSFRSEFPPAHTAARVTALVTQQDVNVTRVGSESSSCI